MKIDCIFQLVDGHTLFDYNVGLNEIIQIMVRAALPPVAPSPKKSVPSAGEESDKENQEVSMKDCTGE